MIIIEQNWLKLVEFMELPDHLLNELLSIKLFNQRHIEEIQASETRVMRNEKMLHMLQRQCVASYNKFINCLRKTKQAELVSRLITSEICDR